MPIQVFYEAEGTQGGKEAELEAPETLEEDILDYNSKLFELEMDKLDSLLDDEKVDQDKLLEWMKGRNEETTINDLLLKQDTDKTDKEDKKEDLKEDGVDKEDPKKEDDSFEKGDQTGDVEGKDKKKVEEGLDGKTKKPAEVDGKKSPKTFKVDDNYINNQVQSFKESIKDQDPETIQARTEAFKDILNGIKGGEMDAHSMKNYVNAQMYIKTIKSPFDSDWKPEKKVVSDPKYIEEATNQKNKMIIASVKAKFPDFPDDAFDNDGESLKDFEDGLSNREYKEYSDLYNSEEARISGEYDRYVYIVNNWEDIAKDTITADVALFKSRLAKLNLTLKDIDIDSLDLSEKDLYNEYLWKNVIFKDGKTDKPNDVVLTFMDGEIPVVKPLGVYQTLMDINMEKIIAKREAIARRQGFEKGLDNQEDPSLSDSPTRTDQRDKVEIDIEDFDDDDLTPEEHQRKLDQLKGNIIRSSQGKKSRR